MERVSLYTVYTQIVMAYAGNSHNQYVLQTSMTYTERCPVIVYVGGPLTTTVMKVVPDTGAPFTVCC